MTNATKRRAILFLILAALITVMLAAALPRLELQKGIPLPEWNTQAENGMVGGIETPLSISVNTFLGAVIGLFVLSVILYLIISRRQGQSWRELLMVLLKLAAASLVITFLLYALSNISINIAPIEMEVLPPEVVGIAGPQLAPVPPFLLWLMWVVLAGLVLLLSYWMARVRIESRMARDQLALEAEQAVEALKAGQGFANVIIRCYEQMSLVLKQEQGLTLEETMTAREFEALLEKRGVPAPPVHQLTQLFEIARYAPRAPGPAEEAQAVACLSTIAQYGQARAKKKPEQPK